MRAGLGPVRDEDAFDVARMAEWLGQHLGREWRHSQAQRDLTQSDLTLAQTPEVLQFSGGASNLTYLLRFPGRDLVLRRAPSGTKARGAHDMGREFELQAALKPVFPQVPTVLALCPDGSVIGSPFYVMEPVAGLILRDEIPDWVGLDAGGVRSLCLSAIQTWVALHSIDPTAAGLDRFGRGPGHVARQVAGWSQRYTRALTPDVGSCSEIMRWLEHHQPEDQAHVVVHNDFRFDNLVLDPDDPTRILAVLDWELASVGDPWLDLGSSLAYWVQADDDEGFRRFRQQPTDAPGMLTRWEVVQAYAQARDLEMTPQQWIFYEVFGLFRLAVIAQQIHFRHFHGQTTNPAFAGFGDVVNYLESRCLRLAHQSRLAQGVRT